MIQNVSSISAGIQRGVFPNIISIRGLNPAKLSVPVHPVLTIYAHFKHIRGIPSVDGGVPMFKLRILDNLIDRLLSYRENLPAIKDLKRLDTENIDPLIYNLQQHLKNLVMSSQPLFGGFYPETGMLVDLVA